MSNPFDRQKEVIDVFGNDPDLILSKEQIKKVGQISYYASTDKHLGFTLTRMVNNGKLKRVVRGYYQLGKNYKNGNGKTIPIPKNQLNLFK